ncbi:hypothetical protein BDV06DRAFT_228785 [Aspergillus oleicola]
MPPQGEAGALDWDKVEPIIRSLYEELTIKELKGIMANEHSFYATEAQFEYRLRKWGCRKNKSSDTWRDLSIKVSKRKQGGKDSAILYRGAPIPDPVAKKEMSRNTRLSSLARAMNAPTPVTPIGFTVSTPLSVNDISASQASHASAESPEGGLATSRVSALGSGASDTTVLSNLSPSPAADSVQTMDDCNYQAMLSPPANGELKTLERVAHTEQELLRSRHLQAAGHSEEAVEVWASLMKDLHKSMDKLRFHQAASLVFQSRGLDVEDAADGFESLLNTRVPEYGICDQLTSDLCVVYISFLIQVLEDDKKTFELKVDLAFSLVTKTELQLETIIGAYFSDEAKDLLMPPQIWDDSWPGTRRGLQQRPHASASYGISI